MMLTSLSLQYLNHRKNHLFILCFEALVSKTLSCRQQKAFRISLSLLWSPIPRIENFKKIETNVNKPWSVLTNYLGCTLFIFSFQSISHFWIWKNGSPESRALFEGPRPVGPEKWEADHRGRPGCLQGIHPHGP